MSDTKLKFSIGRTVTVKCSDSSGSAGTKKPTEYLEDGTITEVHTQGRPEPVYQISMKRSGAKMITETELLKSN
jgi:hypothetical protein